MDPRRRIPIDKVDRNEKCIELGLNFEKVQKLRTHDISKRKKRLYSIKWTKNTAV